MDSSLGAGEEHMPRRRVITEARREQNRIAQLAWRRRQREIRLQKKYHYQDHVTQRNTLQLRPKEDPRSENCQVDARHFKKRTSAAQSRSLVAEISDQSAAEHTAPLLVPAEPYQEMYNGNKVYGADMSHLYPLPILKSSSFFPPIDYSTSHSSTDSALLPSEVNNFNGINQSSAPESITVFSETTALGLPERDEFSQSSFGFSSPNETAFPMISHDSSMTQDPWGELSRAVSPPAIPTHRKTTADGNESWDITMPTPVRSIGLEDIVAAGMQVLLFNQTSHSSIRKRIQSKISGSHLPSPYSNTLDISRTRTLAACLHNAHSMGFAISDVIKPSCIAPSMFYRPHRPEDDLTTLFASASTSNPSMPENLRPTLQQVLHPHPAFLDLIPIPGFRSKVILASVRRGWDDVGIGGLNLFELKRDIFQDGLSWQGPDICGDKSKKIEPWDMMSWEASGWFVRKWSCLIDDSVSVNA